ncbi:MAG: hypothetical protein IKR83_03645 [Bacteroidales bacterium]|nr:hypothetical protein [Bacteroidales bacterium]
MKKALFLMLGLLATSLMAKAQEYIEPVETWKVSEVWGNNYHGWSFHQDWEVDFTVENQDGRFTPTDAEIAEAERLVQKRIAYLNRDHYNQGGMCPIIDEHMRKYRRQYVGFTNDRGDHIIWMSGLWDDELTDERLASDVLLTRGGCGHFWSVKVNLATRKVYGLEVNDEGDTEYLPRIAKPKPRISKAKGDKKMRVRKTGIIHTPEEKVFN